MDVTERKYQFGTEENQAFMKEIREDLLKFGHQFPSPGGSSYYLGDDGTPWKDRNRETWITCRILSNDFSLFYSCSVIEPFSNTL